MPLICYFASCWSLPSSVFVHSLKALCEANKWVTSVWRSWLALNSAEDHTCTGKYAAECGPTPLLHTAETIGPRFYGRFAEEHFPKSELRNGWLCITSRPQGDVIHWFLMFFFSSMSVDIQFCEVVSHIYYCYVNCGHCIRCSWFSQDTHFD